MSETNFQQFIIRLIMDRSFREELKKSPTKALEGKGYRLNQKQLANLKAINLDEIGKIRLDDVHEKLIEKLAASLETERIVVD